MRVVCVSDTHGRTDGLVVPGGDLLIHAGDGTGRGRRDEVVAWARWLGSLPHRHKVVIAGNHDFLLERDPSARSLFDGLTYLLDEGCTVEGMRIWGSPWQPRFFDWAFNLDRGEPLRRVWAKIPVDTDLLVTHGPPAGILDRTAHGEAVGCADLLTAVERIRPKLHVFGHIHEAWGRVDRGGTVFANASICDLGYRPVQAPIVVDL